MSPNNKKRSVVLCPGRGSYGKDSLGYAQQMTSAKLDIADAFRTNAQKPTVREMDASTTFRSSWHVAGEHASILTAAISGADFDQIHAAHEIVAICGNSMGWYTALGLSGAVDYRDSIEVIETMGEYQRGNVIGGQIVVSITDDNWKINPAELDMVEKAIQEIPDLFWSIRLGGQAILGGSNEALETALQILPKKTTQGREFPFRLPLHSAFHTALMQEAHERAIVDLAHISMRSPVIPLVDGRGHIWRPKACSGQDIFKYTFGNQVLEAYDFTRMVSSVLRNFAPDHIILLGPGSNLGGSVAQVLIQEKWKGIQSKQDFIALQESNPFVLAMARPEQRYLVTSSLSVV